MQSGGTTCSAVTNQCSPQPSAFPAERNPLCADGSSLSLHSLSLSDRSAFLLSKREVSFSGPMQVLLMVLVLSRYVKHDVKDAWQECWGGKKGCGAKLNATSSSSSSLIHNPHDSSQLLTANLWFLPKCKRSCFAYYPSPPRDRAIDHRFVQWIVTGWTEQVKPREDRVDYFSTRMIVEAGLSSGSKPAINHSASGD